MAGPPLQPEGRSHAVALAPRPPSCCMQGPAAAPWWAGGCGAVAGGALLGQLEGGGAACWPRLPLQRWPSRARSPGPSSGWASACPWPRCTARFLAELVVVLLAASFVACLVLPVVLVGVLALLAGLCGRYVDELYVGRAALLPRAAQLVGLLARRGPISERALVLLAPVREAVLRGSSWKLCHCPTTLQVPGPSVGSWGCSWPA